MFTTIVRSCLLSVGGFLLVGSGPLLAQTAPCAKTLSDDQQRAVTDYVRRKFKLPDTITLSVKQDSPVRDTCFRELTFEGKSPLKAWELTLYASPDGRFLTDNLFDTAVDPVLEQRAKEAAIMKGLTDGPSATRGPENAAVTIVEFSDFECPFCRNFARILDEALANGEGDVRVVFHHLPLPIHPWARAAAEAAGCAELQSNAAFWSLHDAIYKNQTSITTDNAKQKILELAKATSGLDLPAFQKCIGAGMSVGLVLKDMDLAEANKISGTPTLFINGHRIQGVENTARLREYIAEARKEVGPTPPETAGVQKNAGGMR